MVAIKTGQSKKKGNGSWSIPSKPADSGIPAAAGTHNGPSYSNVTASVKAAVGILGKFGGAALTSAKSDPYRGSRY